MRTMDDTATARKRQRLEDELRKAQERVDQIKEELAKFSASGGEEGSAVTSAARAPSLPTDIWTEVAENLDGSDVLAFALTSKQLRSAQQQAGRMLVTMPIKEKEWLGDEESTDQFPVYFTRSWCAWWSKRFMMTETKPECMYCVVLVAAAFGYLDVLKKYWSNIPEENTPFKRGVQPCARAAGGGHLETLQWLRGQRYDWDESTCYWAASNGQLTTLRWARSVGCPWVREKMYFASAGGGHLSVLKYLRSQGCVLDDAWGPIIALVAAEGGHLESLQWLISVGCPIDMKGCLRVGKPNVVAWLNDEVQD